MTEKETFEEYLKRARWEFATIAEKYSVDEHLELRTAIDSFLIAYDQAVDKALSAPNTKGLKKKMKGSSFENMLSGSQVVDLEVALELIDEFEKAKADTEGRSEQLLFSPDDIEKIIDEKSQFSGMQFRRYFEEK